jgi:beta-lactamase superfamily II metal-dependent hydrolase
VLARQIPTARAFKPGENNAEDPMSVGTLVTFGRFRTIHLGDLTKNKEFELMCPNNRIGSGDVLLGLHHGQDTSNYRRARPLRCVRASPS